MHSNNKCLVITLFKKMDVINSIKITVNMELKIWHEKNHVC